MKFIKKNEKLWVAEQRGVAVFERFGKVGGTGRITSREFKSEQLASEYLAAKRADLLEAGFVFVDEQSGISDPFTPDGKRQTKRPVLPRRLRYLGDRVRTHVAAGYISSKEASTVVAELVAHESGTKSVATVLEQIWWTELKAQRARTPPTPCINARLDEAFVELKTKHVIALQNAGYTKSDGWEDAEDAARFQGPKERWRGACFFSEQDVRSAVKNEGLHLTFGAFAWVQEQPAESAAIGRLIVEVLRNHGIDPIWSGDTKKRIQIPPFCWYRVAR